MSIDVLAAFAVAALAISLAPGVDMAFVVACALADGRRAGVIAACGISVGVAVWVVLTAIGLGAILTTWPALGDALRALGALYLAGLAWHSWRRAGTQEPYAGRLSSARRMFLRGMTTNLLNPKMLLFCTAFLPQFVRRAEMSVATQLLVLGLVLQAVGLAVDASVGLLAGTARSAVLARPAVRTALDRGAATVFALLAIAVLIEALPG